jgi:hypothetical protein
MPGGPFRCINLAIPRSLHSTPRPWASLEGVPLMKPDGVRDGLVRRGLRLEFATLSWNVLGVVVLAVTAVAARSVALAGFGLDSLIEIGASAVVVWELRGTGEIRPPGAAADRRGFPGAGGLPGGAVDLGDRRRFPRSP